MSSYRLLQETVSQIMPLSEEYLLHPSSTSDLLPDVELSDVYINEDMNSSSPPPALVESLMSSPPDTTSSRSANSTLNLNEFYDDVQFIEPEVTDEVR